MLRTSSCPVKVQLAFPFRNCVAVNRVESWLLDVSVSAVSELEEATSAVLQRQAQLNCTVDASTNTEANDLCAQIASQDNSRNG